MIVSLFILAGVGTLLCLAQFLAALPWLAALDWGRFKALLRRPAAWGIALAGVVGAGLVFGLFLLLVGDRQRLEFWGRPYGALLYGQLIADLFVFVFATLLTVWPRGAAVALAAFREGIRQPMFWLLVTLATVLLLFSLVIPYWTFGEDFKMMKHLGYDVLMLFPALFGVIAAGMSIHDEIEGRTAVTLMSKPVSRREFLLGKYLGIMLAALLMTTMLGWALDWCLYLKPIIDPREEASDPLQVQILPGIRAAINAWAPPGEPTAFLTGFGVWAADVLAGLPGLAVSFCQVMILLAIAAALATRLPLVVNLVICLLIYFLGHLAPVLLSVSETLKRQTQPGPGSATADLIHFMARLFDTILPALDFFNLGPAIVRDMPLDLGPYLLYVGSVVLYSVLYSAIALLTGLILFEDRDLA